MTVVGTHASPDGLSPAEAAARLAAVGPNELPAPPRPGTARRALRLAGEPLTLLLLAAAAISGPVLGEWPSAAAIVAIVVANTVVGTIQEGRADRALAALVAMEAPLATVRRGGALAVVPARELVPGDIVVLSAGDRVPADVELLECQGGTIEVDESVLTGESAPVTKRPGGPTGPALPVTECTGTAFCGSTVTRGVALGVVVATGAATRLGGVAGRLAQRPPPTPLQRELARLGSVLGVVAAAVAAGVFALALIRGTGDRQEAFLAAVALAVAAVPEGLGTVVTLALAAGVRRMASRGAIVRRLPAVETLGATTAILTDKTGTLTENRLQVAAVALGDGEPVALGDVDGEARALLLQAAVLGTVGSADPVEVGLAEAFDPAEVDAVRRAHPLLDSVPFDAQRDRATSVHASGTGAVAVVRGAPEVVVPMCQAALGADGRLRALDPAGRARVATTVARFAAAGMRTLALARAEHQRPCRPEEAERDLALVGVVGFRDPLRPEAREALSRAKDAGVRVVMVTGDHPATAAAVARDAGLVDDEPRVVTGPALRAGGLPPDPLAVDVYARVDPDQKLALVEAARRRGEVVAVTGDGVNDAPSLRHADIGVAMGRRGSAVAREAADLVITDDNLATIVAAIAEGRRIYADIRRVVDYLVAGNLSEILVVVGGILAFPGVGPPLLPLQLLWVNFLTDGLPALALGTGPDDPGVLRTPPRPSGDHLLDGRRVARLLARAAVLAGSCLGVLAVAHHGWGEPWAHARALMFTTLIGAHLLYGLEVGAGPAGRAGRFALRRVAGHRRLVAAVAGGLALQVVIVVWPPARTLFGTAVLTGREWALAAAGSVLPNVAVAIGGTRGRRR